MSKRITIEIGLSLHVVDKMGKEEAIKMFAKPVISNGAKVYEKRNDCKLVPDSDIMLEMKFDDSHNPIEWKAARRYIIS